MFKKLWKIITLDFPVKEKNKMLFPSTMEEYRRRDDLITKVRTNTDKEIIRLAGMIR